MKINSQLPLDLSPLLKFSFENFATSAANKEKLDFLKSPMSWTSPIVLLVGPKVLGSLILETPGLMKRVFYS